jgi:hypothetical protein
VKNISEISKEWKYYQYKHLPRVAENKTPRLMDAAREYLLYDESWDQSFNMSNLRRVITFVILSGMLILSACFTPTPSPELLAAQAQTNVPCEACAQATLLVALTQDKNNADNQAAATAEVGRMNAQATLDSANATLSAAQTQDQNSANIVAAQIEATAEIVRANAQATLMSAASTQSAALTADAIRQTQMADLATTGAQVIVNQQNSDKLAAATQTAVADNIATQTQIAVATSQWYRDRSRQRDEQRQGPIAFLWMWCLPMFILVLGGLILWGVWRWLRIQQSNQRILEQHVDRLPALAAKVIDHQHDDAQPYIESDVVDESHPVTNSDDQVRGWIDEVKRNLRRSDEKDENDHADS